MLPPFDYFTHRSACKQKQNERASIIANLPTAYSSALSASDRSILTKPIDELVQDVQRKEKTSALDVLHTYGKVAVRAHAQTNCLTEIMIPEAEQWLERGGINLKGSLAGIPVSLKDSIQVNGFDTTVGYSANVNKPAPKDGAMVRLLKDAGAVPFVKTALPITLLSFESTSDVWGRCTNPHNKDYSPGGSTGGEGALLAYGGSRIGIGSDVAGSVRAPAHYSGCYSLRCSTGRWPKLGSSTSMAGQEGIPSVFSPMTRTLSDLTYFTRAVIQMHPWKYDPSVHPIPWRGSAFDASKTTKPLKIGMMRTDTVVDPSPACARALDQCATALEAEGHTVFSVSPPDPYEALVVASNLLNADGTLTFRGPFRTGETDDVGAAEFGRYMRLPKFIKWIYWAWTYYVRRDPVWAGLLADWHAKSAAEQWKWVARREAYKARWHDWWNSFGSEKDQAGEGLDVILTPPNAMPAVPHGGMKAAAAACGYTFLFNLLDYAVGVLPVTHVDRAKDALPSDFNIKKLNGVAQGAYGDYDAVKMHGLPVGVQVVGRRLEEEKVLGVMEVVEQALDKRGEKYELLEVE